MSERHPFRVAAEAKDVSAAAEVLTEDVILRSPVTFRPFEGREMAERVLGAVLSVFEDFRYLHEARTGDTLALHFAARIGDVEIDGIDLLQLAPDGRVSELSVYVRPLSAVQALGQAMGEALGRS